MNRCFKLLPPPILVMRLALLTTLVGASFCTWAQDSVRPFPATALRGTLQVTQPPDVLLNGQNARLSPGARIRGVNNLLVLSGSLVGQNLVVNYVRDAQGMVHEVWLLNATEARQPMRGAPAQNNYSSDPAPASGASPQ